MEARVFKWSCFGLAAAVSAVLLYMLNDMRVEIRRTNDTVNAHLPQILANVNTATTTLAALSKDINSFRDLAGMVDTPQDRSLVVYADSILDAPADASEAVTQRVAGVAAAHRLGRGDDRECLDRRAAARGGCIGHDRDDRATSAALAVQQVVREHPLDQALIDEN